MRSTAVIGTASIMPVRPHTCEGGVGCEGGKGVHGGARGARGCTRVCGVYEASDQNDQYELNFLRFLWLTTTDNALPSPIS